MKLVIRILLAGRRRRALYARLESLALPRCGVYAAGYAAYIDPRD